MALTLAGLCDHAGSFGQGQGLDTTEVTQNTCKQADDNPAVHRLPVQRNQTHVLFAQDTADDLRGTPVFATGTLPMMTVTGITTVGAAIGRLPGQ